MKNENYLLWFVFLKSYFENFVFLKAVNLLMIIIRYICCILLLAFGYQLAAITLVTALASVLTQIIYAIYCKARLNIKFSFKNYNKELINEIFWFSFFIFLNLFLFMCMGVLSACMPVPCVCLVPTEIERGSQSS